MSRVCRIKPRTSHTYMLQIPIKFNLKNGSHSIQQYSYCQYSSITGLKLLYSAHIKHYDRTYKLKHIYIFFKVLPISDITVSHYVKYKRSNSHTNSLVQTSTYLINISKFIRKLCYYLYFLDNKGLCIVIVTIL